MIEPRPLVALAVMVLVTGAASAADAGSPQAQATGQTNLVCESKSSQRETCSANTSGGRVGGAEELIRDQPRVHPEPVLFAEGMITDGLEYRWNVEYLDLNRSPVGASSLPYAVGMDRPVFHSSFMLWF